MPFVPYTPDTSLVVGGFADGLAHLGDELLLDPRADKPFLYLASAYTYPKPASTLYKVDRRVNAITDQAAILNLWSAEDGTPDMDSNGNLYYACPGGLTNVFQPLGKFSVDALTQTATAERNGFPSEGGYDPGSPIFYGFNGWTRVDRVGTSNHFFHFAGSGSFDVKLHAFDRSSMVLKWVKGVATDLGFAGDGHTVIQDADTDDDNQVWAIVTTISGILATKLYRFQIADGTFTMIADLTSHFTVNDKMALRWLPDDEAFLIANTEKLIKYDINAVAVTSTVLLATIAPTGTITARFLPSRSSLHGPFDGSALWFGYSYIGPNVPPDHTTNDTRMIVRGVRFDTATMAVTDTPEWYVPRSYFPLADGANSFVSVAMVFDAGEYALWGMPQGVPKNVAKFAFIKPPPPPDEPPPPPPPPEIVFLKTVCAPRVITLKTFHYAELFLFGEGVTPMPILNSTIDDLVTGSDDEMIRLIQALPDGITLDKAWFTVKENLTQEDSEALIQKIITATPTADGQITDIGTTGVGRLSFLLVPADTNGGRFSPRKVYWYDLTLKLSDGKIYTGREIGLLRPVAAVTETAA